METWQKHEAGNCRTRKDELRVNQCCLNKLPLPPSSTVCTKSWKNHFHQCVPRNTFFNYIASLRQQAASNGNTSVISIWDKTKFQVLCKIRPLLSQDGHLPLADPSECPDAHPCASAPHVHTRTTVPLQPVGAIQLSTFAVDILEWHCRKAYNEMNSTGALATEWVPVIPCTACVGESGKRNAWWCS